MRLLALAGAAEELAEAEMAVGDEGAHAEFLGERERVTVVAVGVLRGSAAGGDLAKRAESPRLDGALTALAGKGQGSSGEFESVLEPVSENVRFTQIYQEARRERSESHRLNGAHRVLQHSPDPRRRSDCEIVSLMVLGIGLAHIKSCSGSTPPATPTSEHSIPDEDQEYAQEQAADAEGDSANISCMRAPYQERGEGGYR